MMVRDAAASPRCSRSRRDRECEVMSRDGVRSSKILFLPLLNFFRRAFLSFCLRCLAIFGEWVGLLFSAFSASCFFFFFFHSQSKN